MIMTAVVQVSGTAMKSHSAFDQFVCRFWMTRCPLWGMMVSSAYSIVMLTLERYVAIVHPFVYEVTYS